MPLGRDMSALAPMDMVVVFSVGVVVFSRVAFWPREGRDWKWLLVLVAVGVVV